MSKYTYDVVFMDDVSDNSKGFALSIEECKEYIRQYNGTNESYFADYKGGRVCVVNNESGLIVHSEEVK